jgi:hypothetical protein
MKFYRTLKALDGTLQDKSYFAILIADFAICSLYLANMPIRLAKGNGKNVAHYFLPKVHI